MALRDVDNALRISVQTWATANSVAFHWEDSAPKTLPPGVKPTRHLEWTFRPSTARRLTLSTKVRHEGEAVGTLLVDVGLGPVDAFHLAELLSLHIRGKEFAGAKVLDEVAIIPVGREGTRFRVDVRAPWEFDEDRIPIGYTPASGAVLAADVEKAFLAFRELWRTRIATPLPLRTFFDNDMPEPNAALPWALCSFRTFAPFPIETQRIRVPGRVIAAINFSAAGGTDPSSVAVEAIVRAFDGIQFRGVTFETPETNRLGLTPIQTWQANVRLPFYFEVPTNG